MLNIQQLDKLTAQLYAEFYEEHKELFKTNPQEYQRLAFQYVIKGLEKVRYYGKDR